MEGKLQQAKTSLETYTDEQLIARFRSERDNAHIGELFKRYTHLVFYSSKKYLTNKADCSDMVMIVFEKLLKNPPPENILSFKKWLYTITKNECLTFIRTNKRYADQLEKIENFEKKSENFMENPDERSLNSRVEEENRMMEFLKGLKKPQQDCIRLFYMEGKRYKEIEKLTGFTLNEIKSYLQNGKRKLKLLMEG